MKTVKIDVTSDKKASRIELFVRIIWGIPTAIVLFIFGIIAALCLILNWLFILVTGTRHESLNGVVKGYIYYRFKVESYFSLLTDERSPIIPE